MWQSKTNLMEFSKRSFAFSSSETAPEISNFLSLLQLSIATLAM